MKSMRCIAILIALLMIAPLSVEPARAEASFSFFYSNLSPHGNWLVSAEYGQVWQPEVYSPDWNPYYDGHWVYADVGWTWVSDYSWGAIPYHYGTWVLDPRFGWVWVPGTVWAPSWVVFRTGPDYIGWAPVAPSFAVGAWFNAGDPGPFVFVSAGNFLAPRIRRCALPSYQTRHIVEQTRVINRITVENDMVVNRGPDRSLVERATGRRIHEVPIDRVSRVAPSGDFSRQQLRVPSHSGWRSLRAAEPVSERIPAPSRYRRPPASREDPGVREPESRPPARDRSHLSPPTRPAPGKAPADRLRPGTGSSGQARPEVRSSKPSAPRPKGKSQKPPKKKPAPSNQGADRSSDAGRDHS